MRKRSNSKVKLSTKLCRHGRLSSSSDNSSSSFGLSRLSLGLGLGATLSLCAMGLMLFCPITNHVEAISTTPPADSSSTTARIYANSVVSIAMAHDVDLDIMPTLTGSYQAVKTNLRVSTNNKSGYTIYIRSIDNEGKLRAENNVASVASIDSTAVTTSLDQLANNTWGYSIASDGVSNYRGITGTDSIVTSTENAAAATDYNLYFGAKIDTNLPADIYSGEVVISAIANPMTITSLTGLQYMQDMTSDICEASPMSATKRLIDARDGKMYWVTKLADGNCWMTQNLALDIVNEGGVAKALAKNGDKVTLDQSNTNITGTVDLASTFMTSNFPASSDQYTTWSWNLGEYVLATPMANISCKAPGQDDIHNSVMNGQSLGENCKQFWKVQANYQPTLNHEIVANEWEGLSTAPKDAEGNAIGEGIITVDKANETYDAHYLIGNYYQFNTAVAGNGGADKKGENMNISTSICPKGWRLPRGSMLTSGEDYNEFAKVLHDVYGYEYSVNQTNIHTSGGSNQDITRKPMYLLRNGVSYLPQLSLRYAGLAGDLWSATVKVDAMSASDFNMGDFMLAPAISHPRLLGLSIRCVAQ